MFAISHDSNVSRILYRAQRTGPWYFDGVNWHLNSAVVGAACVALQREYANLAVGVIADQELNPRTIGPPHRLWKLLRRAGKWDSGFLSLTKSLRIYYPRHRDSLDDLCKALNPWYEQRFYILPQGRLGEEVFRNTKGATITVAAARKKLLEAAFVEIIAAKNFGAVQITYTAPENEVPRLKSAIDASVEWVNQVVE